MNYHQLQYTIYWPPGSPALRAWGCTLEAGRVLWHPEVVSFLHIFPPHAALLFGMVCFSTRRRITTEEKAIKVVAAAWGMELLQLRTALEILLQDDLKKWTNRRMNTWRMDTSEKWMIIRFTPIPNHHPSKMYVLPSKFPRIILTAK